MFLQINSRNPGRPSDESVPEPWLQFLHIPPSVDISEEVSLAQDLSTTHINCTCTVSVHVHVFIKCMVCMYNIVHVSKCTIFVLLCL